MRRQLSSNFTFIRKYATVMFWLWLLYVFFSHYEFSLQGWSLLFLCFYLLLVSIVGVVALDNFRLKDVSIDAEALYVSNNFKELKLPFALIEEVKSRSRSRRGLMVVCVKLRLRTAFGQEILFEPRWRKSSPEPWEELEEMIPQR